MLFTQFEFIFIFLPATIAGYFLLGKAVSSSQPRLVWLTAASLVFYLYWDVRFLPVIGVSIIGNYLFARYLASMPMASRRRKIAFIAALTANLLALGVFKYSNFAIDIIQQLTGSHIKHWRIVLPLGISFFTFTQIACLADVFAGDAFEANFVKYALFVSYFPHLVAGPILHHREMMPQFG